MSKEKYENDHEEALFRLCFACGELLTAGSRLFLVEKNLPLLIQGLKIPSITIIPGVTPHHFCRKCYLGLSHVVSGKIVQCSRTKNLINWVQCGMDCSTCARLTEMKIPKRRKKVSISLSCSHFFISNSLT